MKKIDYKNISKGIFLGLLFLVIGALFITFVNQKVSVNSKIIKQNDQNILLEQPKKADFTKKSQDEIIQTLSQRKEALLKEVEKDPSVIKKYALPQDVKDNLPEEARGLVEQEIEVTGKLKVLVADDFKNGKSLTTYKLENNKKYNIKFIEEPENLKSSESVTAKGLVLDSTLVLDSEKSPSLTLNSPPKMGLTGAQDTLVLRFNWQNDTSEPFSVAAIDAEMYSGANSADNFYQENSYNQISFPGNTTNVTSSWYTIPYNKGVSCSDPQITNWTLSANSAATTAGYVLGNYDNIIYLFPSNPSCGWSGLGEVGGNLTWINGWNVSDLYVHELGHNVGLGHASYRDCGALSIDNYGNCTTSEYGDIYDVMGWGDNYHFNAAFKNESGWLAPGEIQTVSANGTYTLNVLENAASATKAVKIQKADTGEYYWLEYRQATGFDSTLPGGVTRGLVIHTYNGSYGDNTYLLDMTPANGWSDIALSDGTTFTDSNNSISVTQLSHNASSVTFKYSNELSRPAVFSGATWYLRNTLTAGVANTAFGYGFPAKALMCAWDPAQPGVKLPTIFSNGTWHMRSSYSTGVADLTFSYGAINAKPVCGDWDGDGIETVGVADDANNWHLRNSNVGGPPDLAFQYGPYWTTPVVGDWDGDGDDTIGVFIKSGGWSLRNENSSGPEQVAFPYGFPAQPIVGDWDGDGADNPGLVAGNTWLIRNDNSQGVADRVFNYGFPNTAPVVWK